MAINLPTRGPQALEGENAGDSVAQWDAYFSADVETDGPIPGPYSMLSFALVYAGRGNGSEFQKPVVYNKIFYSEIMPISDTFQQEALDVNRLDRERLKLYGPEPKNIMSEAAEWVRDVAEADTPVLVAYPLSFDWSWLYWYFTMYSDTASPFGYSSCFDVKTALAITARQPVSMSGRSRIPKRFATFRKHTHHAVDDAVEQAEIFANLIEGLRVV